MPLDPSNASPSPTSVQICSPRCQARAPDRRPDLRGSPPPSVPNARKLEPHPMAPSGITVTHAARATPSAAHEMLQASPTSPSCPAPAAACRPDWRPALHPASPLVPPAAGSAYSRSARAPHAPCARPSGPPAACLSCSRSFLPITSPRRCVLSTCRSTAAHAWRSAGNEPASWARRRCRTGPGRIGARRHPFDLGRRAHRPARGHRLRGWHDLDHRDPRRECPFDDHLAVR